MAKLKCLACGQDNKVGEESCARCLSSLNLRLCSACEAINDHTAERCHSCDAGFGDEVAAMPPAQEPARAAEPPKVEPVMAEAPEIDATVQVPMLDETPRRSFPTRRQIEAAQRRGSRVAQAAVVWSVAILLGVGAAYAYHRYQVSGWPVASGLVSARVAAPPEPKPRADATPETKPPSTLPKNAKAPVAQATTGRSVAPGTAPATAAEPKITAEPTSTPTPAPKAKLAAASVAPTSAASRVAANAAPAAAVASPVSAAAAPLPRARVTHTRAPEPGEAAAIATSAPAALTRGIEKPMNPNPSGCAPAVAALGLCLAK